MKIVYYNEFDKDKAAESREQMTERKLMEAQYQAAIEAYKKVSRTRIDDSSRAMIAAIAEHVQYSSEAVLAHDRLITLVREMETVLEGMLRFINVCDHTNTHREGAIWTKCDDCGKRFADDEGGVTPDSDPPQLAKALAALTKAKDAQEEIYAEDHAYQQEMEKLCGGGSFEMKAGFQRGWLSAIRRQSQQVPTAPQPAQEPRYTLKEIEAAILAQGNTDGGWPEFARAIRARLSPAPPDRAPEERVTVRR
jgi:hypothetical protein